MKNQSEKGKKKKRRGIKGDRNKKKKAITKEER
jgi:hypothetical protein